MTRIAEECNQAMAREETNGDLNQNELLTKRQNYRVRTTSFIVSLLLRLPLLGIFDLPLPLLDEVKDSVISVTANCTENSKCHQKSFIEIHMNKKLKRRNVK